MREAVEFYVQVHGLEQGADIDKIWAELEEVLRKHFEAAHVVVELIS